MQNDDVAQLATDLDKAPTGEEVIQRILHAVVLLQRGQAQILSEGEQTDARVERLQAQVVLLTRLVDSHQAEFEILKMREQGGAIVQ